MRVLEQVLSSRQWEGRRSLPNACRPHSVCEGETREETGVRIPCPYGPVVRGHCCDEDKLVQEEKKSKENERRPSVTRHDYMDMVNATKIMLV